MLRRRGCDCFEMEYRITTEPSYLRAHLAGNDSVEEMLQFFAAVVREGDAHDRSSVLLDICSSRPIFHVGARHLFESFMALSEQRAWRLALLADTSELQLSHDYLALLARQLQLKVESFRDEATALRWLTGESTASERRSQEDRRRRFQPHFPEHRLQERRG